MRPTIAGAVLVLGAFLSGQMAFAQTAPPATAARPSAAAPAPVPPSAAAPATAARPSATAPAPVPPSAAPATAARPSAAAPTPVQSAAPSSPPAAPAAAAAAAAAAASAAAAAASAAAAAASAAAYASAANAPGAPAAHPASPALRTPATPGRPPPKPEPLPPAFRLTISPEWAYRVFRDVEAGSTDKTYTANGVFALGARAELYPLAFVRPALATWRDFGMTGSYSRAFGLHSQDIDTNTEIDTQWYQFSFGLRYRILGGKNPLAIGFTAGVERWVFDYSTAPPSRPVAVGRYTLLPVGVDARYVWGSFRCSATPDFCCPSRYRCPANRMRTGGRWGAHVALAAASSIFEFSKPSFGGRTRRSN